MSEIHTADSQTAPSPAPEEARRSPLDQVIKHVADLIGVGTYGAHQIRGTFSEVLKRRRSQRVEDSFAIGTSQTTPSIESVSTDWPKPWVFFYVLTFSLAAYSGLSVLWEHYVNTNVLPGIILTGAFAVPISVIVFLFETNAPKNVSPTQVIWLFLVGGVVSLIAALILFDVTDVVNLGWMGASVAGLAEEPAKVLALLLILFNTRYRYTHNGLLFGAAVGAGFAAFESAGYAFTFGMQGMGQALAAGDPRAIWVFADRMEQTIFLRGVLAPFGHVAWTAMCGGMLWKVKGDRKFEWSMLVDSRFLRVLGLAVVLHMLYNTDLVPGAVASTIFRILLGIVAWLVIFALLADGLKQVRDEQAARKAAQDREDPTDAAPAP